MTRSELPHDEGGYLVMPKKIGLGILGAILLKVFIVAFWLVSISNRVSTLETTAMERRATVEARFAAIAADREGFIRLQEQVRLQTDVLRRIEGRLFGGSREPRDP